MTFQQGCFNLQLYFSSRRFGTVAAWRAQRTGYPPPPRSGWSGVCGSGVQSFQKRSLGGPPRALRCQRQPPSRPYLIQFFDSKCLSSSSNPVQSFQLLSRSSQHVAKIAQEIPTYGQACPKYSPRASNQTPQDPKMWPKRCSVVRFYTSAIFLKIAPKTNKNVQKSSPNGLKMAILAPTWKLLAPSWLQLGAILPHLGEILVDPSPAKIDQNQPRQLLRDFLSQGRPQELPDPLQTPSRS